MSKKYFFLERLKIIVQFQKFFIVNMVPPNNVHMFWQIPQLVIFTIAEIFFVITGLEFSFTQVSFRNQA